jgi:ATP/ADP translocase
VNLLIARAGWFPLIFLSLLLYGLAWGTRAISEWAYLSAVFGLGSMLGSLLAGALSMVLPYGDVFLLSALLNLSSIPMIIKMRSSKDAQGL